MFLSLIHSFSKSFISPIITFDIITIVITKSGTLVLYLKGIHNGLYAHAYNCSNIANSINHCIPLQFQRNLKYAEMNKIQYQYLLYNSYLINVLGQWTSWNILELFLIAIVFYYYSAVNYSLTNIDLY